jgi:molybdopterin-guanine dinucleotide biosynthesis protein A
MYVAPKLTVAVQAGGESRRMGRSKATVPFGGRPLLCTLVERVAPIADEVLITTNEPQNLGFLDQMPEAPKIRLERDLCDCRGSLTGLYTALATASHDWVAVCACDMMSVSAELFAFELRRAVEGAWDVVVPVNDQGFEPFHAVYRRQACLEEVRRALAAGKKSMKAVVTSPELAVCHVSMDEVYAVVPDGGCFANCNTPEELARAEERTFGAAAPGTAPEAARRVSTQ